MTDASYYEILGVSPRASQEEIGRAYKHRAELIARERHGAARRGVVRRAEEEMRIVNEAWSILGDPKTRSRYDEALGLEANRKASIRPVDSKEGLERRSVPSEYSTTDWQRVVGGSLAAIVHGLEAVADWLGQPSLSSKVVVPDFQNLKVSETFLSALRRGVKTEIVRLTEHPAPTDGVVVDQKPASGTKVRRNAVVTLKVRHRERD